MGSDRGCERSLFGPLHQEDGFPVGLFNSEEYIQAKHDKCWLHEYTLYLTKELNVSLLVRLFTFSTSSGGGISPHSYSFLMLTSLYAGYYFLLKLTFSKEQTFGSRSWPTFCRSWSWSKLFAKVLKVVASKERVKGMFKNTIQVGRNVFVFLAPLSEVLMMSYYNRWVGCPSSVVCRPSTIGSKNI